MKAFIENLDDLASENSLKELILHCRNRSISDLELKSRPSSADIHGLFCRYGAVLKQTYFDMFLHKMSEQPCSFEQFSIVQAMEEDIQKIVQIGIDAFGTTEDKEISYVKSLLNSDHMSIFLAFDKEDSVGYIAIHQKPESIQILDFAIMSKHRRKGYGDAVLSALFNSLLRGGFGVMSVEVQTKNPYAKKLYEKKGFEHRFTRYLLEISSVDMTRSMLQ